MVKEELEKVGLGVSVSGPRVRQVVSCPGIGWCPWAWIDTKNFAEQIEKEFYGKEEIEIYPLNMEVNMEVPGIKPEEI